MNDIGLAIDPGSGLTRSYRDGREHRGNADPCDDMAIAARRSASRRETRMATERSSGEEMPTRSHGHAFISYMREDSARVGRLQSALEAAGIRVWRDTDDLWPGQDWRLEIRRAITDGSLAFLACFSENTTKRETSYQNEELVLAVEEMRRRQPGRPWLIPIRFSDCILPSYDLGAARSLGSLQRVDLFDDRWEHEIARLVISIKDIIGADDPINNEPTRPGKVLPSAKNDAESQRLQIGRSRKTLLPAAKGLPMRRRPALVHVFRHPRDVNAAIFSPDSIRLATACEDRQVRIFGVVSGELRLTFAHAGIWVTGADSVAFSPNGRWLASSNGIGVVRVWDTVEQREQLKVQHFMSWAPAVAFSPNGKWLASASSDHTARVWSTLNGNQRLTMNHDGLVWDVTFSPDGQLVATASMDGTAKIWDASSGYHRLTITHRIAVAGVAFSPDSHRLATASWDQTARIWDVKSGTEYVSVLHDKKVWGVTFSPDGNWLATASEDHTVRIWDANNGDLRFTATHDNTVRRVAFSPDQRWLATASWDNTARVWSLA